MIHAPTRTRRTEAGKVNLIGLIIAVVLAVGGLLAYLFVPYHLDYMNMKEVVSSASLAWYANDAKSSGERKLEEQLRAKEGHEREELATSQWRLEHATQGRFLPDLPGY